MMSDNVLKLEKEIKNVAGIVIDSWSGPRESLRSVSQSIRIFGQYALHSRVNPANLGSSCTFMRESTGMS